MRNPPRPPDGVIAGNADSGVAPDGPQAASPGGGLASLGADPLAPLLNGRNACLGAGAAAVAPAAAGAVTVGELIALADDGHTPLVVYPGQPGTAALRARTVTDLHAAHIGCPVVLVFEGGDGARPIVMGVLRDAQPGGALAEAPSAAQIDADGERFIVTAREQLVLRCGQASITLTRAGQVLIQGRQVSSRASGVNRVLGGSVQLN